MKYLLFSILTFSITLASSQSRTDNIYKAWVVNHVTYKDGSELPEAHLLKYIYLKYIFTYPKKLNTSTVPYEHGTERSFDIENSALLLYSPEGTIINTQQILELSDNKLVLRQAGREGYDDPTSIVYTFVPENLYQQSISLRPGDIFSVFNNDTTYVQSPKIYADYQGDSFQHYVYEGIHDRINMDGRVGRLVASFTVSKKGIADSVKILEGIDTEFDKRFLRVFNQAKKNWRPAMLDGKPVAVRMNVILQYSTSATTLPAYFTARKGLDAYNNKDYEVAEYYYEQAIKSAPEERELYYKRGMCRLLLGNKAGACEDWNTAKGQGSTPAVDALLEKYCN